MERIAVEDVDRVVQPADVMRPLTDALGLEDFAMNHYELAPGDSFAYAYHRHGVQEEVFVVLEGTATFETEDGPVVVDAGEAVRFAPGEFQRGWNRGDERVVALAFGAPLEYGEQVTLRECPDCGERTDQRIESAEDGDARVTHCEVCGTRTGRWTLDSNPPGN
jgi:uncharacterized cupin superfamily protein